MKYVTTFETYETMTSEQVSTKRRLPTTPFPRKYVLSVFVDERDAQQAAQALLDVGFAEQRMYILNGRDFAEAVAQNQTPFDFLTSMNYDIYLREAGLARSFLAVRPADYAQLRQIRDLLASHHAYLAS